MSKPARTDKEVRLYQIFSARLVLEVFGGAGAIWGFSEALGLRVPATVWFWRPCALTFGAIFFVRWLMQIQDYIADEDVRLFKGRAGDKDPEQLALDPQAEKVYG